MPEINDVVSSTVITSEWGNSIRDRTIQRYADADIRNTKIPSPSDGDLSFLTSTGELSVYYAGAWRGFIPPGAVMPYAGASAPTGWLICNGAAISRTTYANLFAVIGDTYGPGDGSTTFNLPDMRQRFPLGVAATGTGSTRGDTGGQINHTHSGPAHTHTGAPHTHTTPEHQHPMKEHRHTFSAGFTTGYPSAATFVNSGTAKGVGTNLHTHSGSVSGSTGYTAGETDGAGGGVTGPASAANTGTSGTGQTGTNNPPYLALHYIIRH